MSLVPGPFCPHTRVPQYVTAMDTSLYKVTSGDIPPCNSLALALALALALTHGPVLQMAEYSSEDEERRPGGRSSSDLTPDTDFDFELAGYGGQQPQGFFSRPAQSEAAARKTERQRHSKPEARPGSQAKVGEQWSRAHCVTRPLLSRGRSRS